MKWNYGEFDDIITSITTYITSLKTIEAKIKDMDQELAKNNSFTTNNLFSMTQKFSKGIGGCKDELSDLYEAFSGFLEGMEGYLTPKAREGDIKVDDKLSPCLAEIDMAYENYLTSYKQLSQGLELYGTANVDDLEEEEKTNQEQNYRTLNLYKTKLVGKLFDQEQNCIGG